MHSSLRTRGGFAALALAAAAGFSACADGPTAAPAVAPGKALSAKIAVDCTASVRRGTVSCGSPSLDGARAKIVGGQNSFVRLTSSNLTYDPGAELFQFDLTVQNLMNEALGTPDGVTADPDGILVFIHSDVNVTAGTGQAFLLNQDGITTQTATGQAYIAYPEILVKDEVSAAKTWQFHVDDTVDSFTFQLLLESDAQYLLVINEILVNPAGSISDANGEWVELYNAGSLTVDLQNLVIADSAGAGRRAYHRIGTSLKVLPGAYATLGKTTNTTSNGGVPVDYVHTMQGFPNSLGAFKISRVVGTDTLTIDRTQFASAAISAQNGVSRELKNPALDNSNMDGSNWADASVTAVYGPGGRGTPKAQNSTYTP